MDGSGRKVRPTTGAIALLVQFVLVTVALTPSLWIFRGVEFLQSLVIALGTSTVCVLIRAGAERFDQWTKP